MACLVYIDETGSVGKGAKKQPLLTLMAVMIDEAKVQPLATRLKQVAWDHLGWSRPSSSFTATRFGAERVTGRERSQTSSSRLTKPSLASLPNSI